MPGQIMTASKAKKVYLKLKSIVKRGDKVTIRNSSGKKVTVGSGTNVYHRGHGKFGIYDRDLDKKRHSKGSSKGNRVGTGSKRQTKI